MMETKLNLNLMCRSQNEGWGTMADLQCHFIQYHGISFSHSKLKFLLYCMYSWKLNFAIIIAVPSYRWKLKVGGGSHLIR